MIYFFCTLIAIVYFHVSVSDLTEQKALPMSLFAAVVSIIAYIALKGFMYRIQERISQVFYRLLSFLMVPVYALSIISFSNATDHIHYLQNIGLLILVALLMSDVFDINTQYLKNSGVFGRQKDSFFYPARDSSDGLSIYFVKIAVLYAVFVLFSDQLTI